MEEDKHERRWRWLAKNYHKLPDSTRNAVYNLYEKNLYEKYFLTTGGYHQANNREMGDALYRAMMEIGVKLEGIDPYPPPIIPMTQDGAEQYDDIMAAQELMNV